MKRLDLPQTARSFSITRDVNGVPHIDAKTWLDALAGLGYVHAVDRGTQMYFSRSVASGRAAEQIAARDEVLETDRFFRRIGLHRDLEAEIQRLPEHIRVQLAAYCSGVNDAFNDFGRSLPMWAVSYPLHTWDAQSVLLIGKLLSFGGLAVSQMQNERLLIELIHSGVNENLLRELFAPRLDNLDFEMVRRIRMSNQLSDEALEVLSDLPRLAGSNAWAVAPHRSATGHALLAADPHLEVNRLPAVWYEAVLRWGPRGEHFVMGATLPGCPLFAVARTERVSWGVTYMKGDTFDFFVEDVRPDVRSDGESVWQYRRGDAWHNFQVRDEWINQKNGETTLLRLYESPQGVLEGDPEQLGAGLQLSWLWSGSAPGHGSALSAWLNIVAAKSVQEAMQAARECSNPTLCWVLADCDGHIGMQSCGRIPLRGGGQIGLAPIPAWDEGNHWCGSIESWKLPQIFDPVEGFVATANEELNPPDLPMLVTQPLPGYRKRRIVERLRELPLVTLKDMQDLQYDVLSVQARDLLALFLPHIPPGPLRDCLSEWDYRYNPESRAAALFHRLYINVMVELLGTETGIGWRRMIYLCTRIGYSMMIVFTADRLLLARTTALGRRPDIGDIFRRAAEKTARENEMNLTWSELNQFHFADRFFGGRQVGRLLGFESRRYPMPGNHATPFQGHVLQTATRETTFAPSYHFVTDMGVHEAWSNLPGGPSENRFSRWYKSDIGRWFTQQYKRLSLSGE